MLNMMFRNCMNNAQTGGEEGLFYSQLPKLAVGAPTDTSWTPRAHGTSPCPRGTENSLQQPTKTVITLAYGLRIR